MSEVKVNKISPRSGTAITLGDSGDTFTIPSGATLAIAGSVTGFTSAGIDDNATSVAITINSSEQVGIGTTSFDQDAKLTIAGSGSGGSNPSSISANTVATFRRTGGTSHVANISVLSGTTGASILNLGDRDDEDVGNIIYEHSSNYMAFTTGASERLRITSGGDVGIGTSAPNRLLTLGGTANARLGLNASSYRNYSLSSDVYGFSIYDDTSTAYRLTVNASGQVGIGTTSPTRNLQIQSSASTIVSINSGNSSESQLFFADTDDDNIGRIAYDHSTNAMEFWTNDNERMRIDSSGNLSIGHTTSGGSKLAICDGANAQIQFFPEISTDTNLIQHYDPTATAYMASDNRASQYLFKIGTSEKMRIDSSGNVGIGISNPSTYDDGGDKLVIGRTDARSGMTIVSSTSTAGSIHFADGTSTADSYRGIFAYYHNDNSMRFYTNGSNERMRIDTSGIVLVNGTSADGAAKFQSHLGTSGYCASMYSILNQADYITFRNDGGEVGSIKRSGGSGVAYNTSSDYRLKENVSYDFDATTRIKQLKPARFNFIADDTKTVDGFIAHEVSSVVPEAISGEKDETETKEKVVVNANGNVIAENIEQADWETGKIADEDGNTKYPTDSTWEATKVVPVYQGIDQSKLVPLLVKTIQEQQTKIEELEARITTLEANNP